MCTPGSAPLLLSVQQPAPLWCVAENYRSIPAFLRLRQAIAAGELGAVVRLDMSADLGERASHACNCAVGTARRACSGSGHGGGVHVQHARCPSQGG